MLQTKMRTANLRPDMHAGDRIHTRGTPGAGTRSVLTLDHAQRLARDSSVEMFLGIGEEATDAGRSGQGDPFTHDGGDWKPGHCTRTRSPPGSPRTRSEVSSARPQPPGHTRYGVSSIRSGVLRSRLLLAPSYRVPVHHHPCHSQGVLAIQVPCQRDSGQAQSASSDRSRMESGDCLGMRVAETRWIPNRAEAGSVAARS